LKFDIERCCIYTLFTTFRESIYTNTLYLVVCGTGRIVGNLGDSSICRRVTSVTPTRGKDCNAKECGHPCKEREEGKVNSFVHVKGFKLLIVNEFECLVPHGVASVGPLRIRLPNGTLKCWCLDGVLAPIVSIASVVHVVCVCVHT